MVKLWTRYLAATRWNSLPSHCHVAESSTTARSCHKSERAACNDCNPEWAMGTFRCPWPCMTFSSDATYKCTTYRCTGVQVYSEQYDPSCREWKKRRRKAGLICVTHRQALLYKYIDIQVKLSIFLAAKSAQCPTKKRQSWFTPHIKMGQFENFSYNSEFHAQKQSSGNWIYKSCICMYIMQSRA